MPLRNIVHTLGGDLYDANHRANIPAPGHTRNDRSVSLLVVNGRIVVKTFGRTPWQEVLDDLRERCLIDAHNAPTSVSASAADYHAPPRTQLDRTNAARSIWDEGRPAGPASLTARHATLRKISRPLPDNASLRHGTSVPISAYAPTGRTKPAMLLGIRDPAGDLAAVEITYLASNGTRDQFLRLSRKTIGAIPTGSAVRIDEIAPDMLVGEGFFTTLAASQRFNLPSWALLSTSNMRFWTPPSGVRSVLVAGDNGPDGRQSAGVLAERLRALGLRAWTEFPDQQHGDWADAAPPLHIAA